ncbi:hypothetical protein [Rhizobium leguminosarum]|uniref:hypothetical protein n=1 Tax=Rhizobium leguminosarum TaxID=384 RepID=UPI001031B4BA|nr:hypothetical protein [Rhizobium leguminosarum]TAX30766.1 hypothetical protein ELI04_13770 [Rhizobium leguminosarum]
MLAPPSLSIGVQNSPFIGIQNLHAETHERLQKMTPEQRATLHDNARKRIDNGGREIIELFESSGLPLSSGGMRLSDPVYQRMEEIVWSSEGKRLLLQRPRPGCQHWPGSSRSLLRILATAIIRTTTEPKVRVGSWENSCVFSSRTCRSRGHACRIGGESSSTVEIKETLNPLAATAPLS